MNSWNKEGKEWFAKLAMPMFNYGPGMNFVLNGLDLEEVYHDGKMISGQKITAPSSVNMLNVKETDKYAAYVRQLVSPTENKIIARHYALLQDIAVIVIPKGKQIGEPIQIDAAEQVVIIAEAGSKAKIVEKVHTSKYNCSVVQLYIQEKAELEYVYEAMTSGASFLIRRAEILRQGRLVWNESIIGTLQQAQLSIFLDGEGAQAEVKTAFRGQEGQQDISTEIVHRASHTESSLYAKGIAEGKAKILHRGKIVIEKQAFGCVGHQKTDALILSEEARCQALPILEVHNDEVICSHGASIGQLDEELLFYFLSRGVGEEKAREMIVEGFLVPIAGGEQDASL